MSEKQTVSTSGIGFGGALFFVFLVLKLTGYITWSWWWITAPLWGGVVIVLGVALLALAVIGIVAAVKALQP